MKSLLIVIALCLSTFGQDKPDTDKHVITLYDKFRDVTRVISKPDDVTVIWQKRNAAAAMSIGWIQPKDKEPVRAMFIALSPNAVSKYGAMANEYFEDGGVFMKKHPSQRNKLTFQQGAEVILLVNNERFRLDAAEKVNGFDGGGNWRDDVWLTLPVDAFRKMVTSERWELMIGDIVIDFRTDAKANLGRRVQPRLAALLEVLNKTN